MEWNLQPKVFLITGWVGGCKHEGCSQVFLLFLGIYLQPPESSPSPFDSETAFNFKWWPVIMHWSEIMEAISDIPGISTWFESIISMWKILFYRRVLFSLGFRNFTDTGICCVTSFVLSVALHTQTQSEPAEHHNGPVFQTLYYLIATTSTDYQQDRILWNAKGDGPHVMHAPHYCVEDRRALYRHQSYRQEKVPPVP